MTASRESPVSRVLHQGARALAVVHGMSAVTELDTDDADAPVGLADASALLRLGVKGPAAQRFLEEQGVTLPSRVNSFLRSESGELSARLGRAELFLEDPPGGTRVAQLQEALRAAPGVYPVPRQDAAFVLFGARAGRVLAQTVNFDFRTLCREATDAVLTMMAGVSVLVIGYELGGAPHYRVWCDPSFGPYLCATLLQIVREEGGRETGLFTALGHAPARPASPEAEPLERNEP